MEVFLSNSSNYTKDVVVFFDGLYKRINGGISLNLFTETLQKVKEKKQKAIENQKFELACGLRDIEREMYIFSYNNSTNDLKSLVKHLTVHKFYYKELYNEFLIPFERLDKLEQINIIIKPLIRKDKIKKMEKLYKKI